MNYKALALGSVVGFLVAVAPSCGGGGSTSSGGGSGSKGGGTASASGGGTSTSSGGGVGSSGGGVGSSGGGGTSSSGGGGTSSSGGGSSSSCGSCSGCCAGAACIPLINQSKQNCGSNGAACMGCGTGQNCVNGTCTTPPMPDGGVGGIGAACGQASDCSNVPTGNITYGGQTFTSNVYCKTVQDVGGAPYPGGFCTKKCLVSSNCGTNGVCLLGLGFTGEADNFCSPKCGANAPCRTGYNCVQVGTGITACLLASKDGGIFDEYDAGPNGAPGITGAACSDDMNCRPPDTGACIKATLPDGGPTGYPGGSCISECTMSGSDSYCGVGGSCGLYLDEDLTIDPRGVFIYGLCTQDCDAGVGVVGQGNCRTGYTCSGGSCRPRCDNAGAACPQGATCNTTTGACQ